MPSTFQTIFGLPSLTLAAVHANDPALVVRVVVLLAVADVDAVAVHDRRAVDGRCAEDVAPDFFAGARP